MHQLVKMNSDSLTNFAVSLNHVTTIMSEVEILSPFARNLCSTAQHFVYTGESSIQRSELSVFIVFLKLPSSTIRNPFTNGSPIESSISCCLCTKTQWERVHCSSCVQVQTFTHSNRFGLLLAPRSKIQSENELAEVSYVCSQPSCHPTELQPSFHSSQFQPSFQEVSVGHVCADS